MYLGRVVPGRYTHQLSAIEDQERRKKARFLTFLVFPGLWKKARFLVILVILAVLAILHTTRLQMARNPTLRQE